MTMKTKLIEVALPLEAINRESAREKSISRGHPSTFHLWWARRPLAACRAILFASLVDDPSAHPDRFPDEGAQERERQRLFALIEELVKWDNTTNEKVLNAARDEISSSCGGSPPAILDPFAGGGSIPLEAQRLGLATFSSDLNPVAVLINKALTEIPSKFAGRPPLNPGRLQLDTGSWRGAEGLAADVRYYSQWLRDEAKRRIGHLYPDVDVPSGKSHRSLKAMAWLWARTVTCPNPACGSRMPLLTSFSVSKRKGSQTWLRPEPDRPAHLVRFVVDHGPGCPAKGSVGRSGASCLVCGESVPLSYIRQVAREGDLGAQLLCTVADGGGKGRLYVAADGEQAGAADVPRPDSVPESDIPYISGIFNTPIYGIDKHWKLFTNRQLVTLTTFSELALEARQQAVQDGADPEYADAILTYLALTIGRLANRSSAQCFWNPNGEKIEQVFARQALPMNWAYAEANPFSDSSGNYLGQASYLLDALERAPALEAASCEQLDAAAAINGSGVVCTDPPYYNNIPYADLSDFFYVWFRPMLRGVYPDLFSTILVPKAQELIADPTRQGDAAKAATFFEAGLRKAFGKMLEAHNPSYPMTIFYAFKQAEDVDDGAGRVSTGWETMLQGLLDAGASITGTWPVRTERAGGLREVGRAALASSIVLVCRKRLSTAPLATRKEFVTALRAELPEALRQLQHGNIAPVDLAQASIGPGMAVFSRYTKVVEADGQQMRVRVALGLINDVLDEILSEQEGELDPDSRWAVAWFEECGMNDGSFGKAETLSKAKNTAINGLVHAGIVQQKGNKVKLLERGELSQTWDPSTDPRLTVWEVTQNLITALEKGGEQAAAHLLSRVGELGESARDLAYRLYTICEKKHWTSEALAYNALVVAWPEVSRLASGAVATEESLF